MKVRGWTTAATVLAAAASSAEPVVLVNHVGYDMAGSKRAVVQGRAGDSVRSCAVVEASSGTRVAGAELRTVGPVARWRDWTYWTADFSPLAKEGAYRVTCATARGEASSPPFLVERSVLERRTLSDVLYYFKGQRSSGPIDEADRALLLDGRRDRVVDAHGGWYDATGDYGKHLSHLSYSTYFNPQQIPLTAWGLLKAYDLLQRRSDPRLFRQDLRRLLDEGAYGADYLVRVKAPGGSFYRSVSAPGPGKRPADRRIGREGGGAPTMDEAPYQSSFRAGGGVAIAALAQAALLQAPGERAGDYLPAAEAAWARSRSAPRRARRAPACAPSSRARRSGTCACRRRAARARAGRRAARPRRPRASGSRGRPGRPTARTRARR